MGFDLGALLRGGGAAMSGYTEGQNERKKREEEARRAALSDALMNAQFKTQAASQANYASLAEQRRNQALIDQQRADAYERNLNDQISNRGLPKEPNAPTPSESRAAHGDRLRLVRTRATEMTRPETNVYSGATDDQESMMAFVQQLQQEFPDVSRSELAAELYTAKDDYAQEQRSAASAERADSRRSGSAFLDRLAGDPDFQSLSGGQGAADPYAGLRRGPEGDIDTEATDDPAAVQALEQERDDIQKQIEEAMTLLQQLEQGR